MRTQQDNVSKALSTVPGSWEVPRTCQHLPSLPMMVTDILTTSQAHAQAETRHFPCSILLTITETLSPVRVHLQKALYVQALDQGHRESTGAARPQYTFPSSPESDSGALHLEMWAYRWASHPHGYSTDRHSLVSSDILVPRVPFLAKESLPYWPKAPGPLCQY